LVVVGLELVGSVGIGIEVGRRELGSLPVFVGDDELVGEAQPRDSSRLIR